jgi:cytochrome P450
MARMVALFSRLAMDVILPALVWLTASLKEAMRLYPPGAAIMTRRTTQDMQLGGLHIPRGAMLLQRYQLVQPDDAPPCTAELNVTLRPRGGVTLTLRRV